MGPLRPADSSGEVVVSRDHELQAVELTVRHSALPSPRVYAFPLVDTLVQFFTELAADIKVSVDVIELVAASGSTMSKGMAHSFAWKPGRRLCIDGKFLRVSFAEVDADHGSPLIRRASSKLPKISSDRPPMKYVVVTGGVVSGLGKGVTASSLGVLMKQAGYRVTSIKIDPYLNVDAGTMSPFEHGEVFVLDDGGEADLDLGNYERFVSLSLTRDHNITTGKIYKSCIEKERRGDYLGKTVQVVPHVTDCIMEWIERVAHLPTDGAEGPPDACVIELGGTVGDIESSPFVEALRQFQFRVGRENMCFFHVSLVPIIGVVGEEKTKPTQHSVQQLRAAGLTPDFLVCRSGAPLSSATKHKLALFCHVPPEHCLGVHDVSNIYRVPLLLNHQGLTKRLLSRLDISPRVGPYEKNLIAEWTSLAELVDSLSVEVSIAVVGKYTDLSDAYLSVNKALLHASFAVERKLRIRWIDSSHLDETTKATDRAAYDAAWTSLTSSDGVLVPGGFGIRAVDGKIAAARYARENNKPYLGICLGFQLAVIEYARNVLGIQTAHSAELQEDCPTPLVIFMPEGSRTQMGGTMRLGSRRTMLKSPKCITAKLYNGATAFDERHRHRYEVNPEYVQQLEAAGLEFVGRDTTGERMEVFEVAKHPYYIGCQFHPEFKSRPLKPSPLFLGLLQAAAGLAAAPA